MLLKPLTVAAGLAAASANAFLLPPEVTKSDVDIANDIGLLVPNRATLQVVKIDCPGCPAVVHTRHGTKRLSDKPNHLELTFSIDHQPDSDRLLLNGVPLYPITEASLRAGITAPQFLDAPPSRHRPEKSGRHRDKGRRHHKDDDGEHKHHRRPWGPGGPWAGRGPRVGGGMGRWELDPQPLGFFMNTQSQANDGLLELTTVDFQITEVGHTSVPGLPRIHMKLIKTLEGRLMILDTEVTPSVELVSGHGAEVQECRTMFCKWLSAILTSKPPMPCHGQRPDGAATPQPTHGHGRMGQHHGAKGQKTHHEHSWGQLFKNIASHILLPVLVGIIAGVSVSL